MEPLTLIKHQFVDPVTREPLTDPVIYGDGYTYNREFITRWTSLNDHSSPILADKVRCTNLVTNRIVKEILDHPNFATASSLADLGVNFTQPVVLIEGQGETYELAKLRDIFDSQVRSQAHAGFSRYWISTPGYETFTDQYTIIPNRLLYGKTEARVNYETWTPEPLEKVNPEYTIDMRLPIGFEKIKPLLLKFNTVAARNCKLDSCNCDDRLKAIYEEFNKAAQDLTKLSHENLFDAEYSIGFNFSRLNLKTWILPTLHFESLNVKFANFSLCKFSNGLFINTRFFRCSFEGATFEGCIFKMDWSFFTRSSFGNAKFKNCRFVELEGVDDTEENIKAILKHYGALNVDSITLLE